MLSQFTKLAKPRPFVFTVDTALTGSAADTFVLPINSTYGCRFVVEWGDGSLQKVTEPAVDNTVTHVYPASGVYRIKIHGVGNGLAFPRMTFSSALDALKVTGVLSWGDIRWNNFSSMFAGCRNLVAIPSDRFITQATLYTSMFFDCSSLNMTLTGLDTIGASTLAGLFRGCTVFNQPVTSLRTQNVSAMNSMFRDCPAFKQDVSHFDIRSLTNATTMFFGCDINDVGTTTRYDALLNSWAAQAFLPNVVFHGGTSKYSSAASVARDALVAAGWTITDGGLA